MVAGDRAGKVLENPSVAARRFESAQSPLHLDRPAGRFVVALIGLLALLGRSDI
jgi:hypothetical protein